MTAILNWHLNCDGDMLPGGRSVLAYDPDWRPGESVRPPLSEGCDWWHDSGDSRTKTAARRAARDAGWTRRRVDGALLDLCSSCTAKAADEGDRR